ncbi:MAG: hypothetical protein JKX75_10085, partial [Gammaproteobacteria bacterium]|nr:hypothetical protein [Gammaproteobacteria bacterium]
MLLRNSDSDEVNNVSLEIEHLQIDFINKNRVTTVSTMILASLFLYALLQPRVDMLSFTIWLCLALVIDSFRLYATFEFLRNYKNNCVDYTRAKWHIFIGTILSGGVWGFVSVILLTALDEHSIMLVIIWLIVIANASTTTLSYIFRYSVVFLLLVLLPLVVFLPLQSFIVDTHLFILEGSIIVL